MSELKCCPFCGGNVTAYADRYEKVMIECDNCKMYFGVQLEIGCELKDGWKATLNSKEDAIKRWNTRTPMANILEKLEEKTEFLKDCTKYGNESAEQQEKSYSTMMMYEVADLVDDLIDIVKQEINNGLE